MYNHPLFAPKQTLARIDFLQQGWRLAAKRALIVLKFFAEKLTKFGRLTSRQVNKLTRE